MVAIVQSDPYQALSRKIGYSVGLESLLRNCLAITEIYFPKGELSLSTWKSLVKDEFKRKGEKDRPAIEIANFLSTLKLIRIFGNELHPLYGLDILSILKRYFSKADDNYLLATKVILTFLLLEADGDIFLNSLAARFDEGETKKNLEDMIRIKWDKLQPIFNNPALQHKIWDAISIKSQNAAESTNKHSHSPFKHTTQSPFTPRTDTLGERPETKPSVGSSYLRKTVPTRKGWAKDLDYYDDSGLTTLGESLLECLKALRLEDSNSYCFWPYENDLHSLRIDPVKQGLPSLNSWEILKNISNAYLSVQQNSPYLAYEKNEVLSLLWEIFQLYRSGSSDRGLLRHQLPLYIAKPVIAGIAIATGHILPPIDAILSEEYKQPERNINFINIRGTEGAITIKKKP